MHLQIGRVYSTNFQLDNDEWNKENIDLHLE